MIQQSTCMSLPVQTGHVNMSSMMIDFVRGLALGFEYIDDYEDEEGTAFLVVFHLLVIRVVLIWMK